MTVDCHVVKKICCCRWKKAREAAIWRSGCQHDFVTSLINSPLEFFTCSSAAFFLINCSFKFNFFSMHIIEDHVPRSTHWIIKKTLSIAFIVMNTKNEKLTAFMHNDLLSGSACHLEMFQRERLGNFNENETQWKVWKIMEASVRVWRKCWEPNAIFSKNWEFKWRDPAIWKLLVLLKAFL